MATEYTEILDQELPILEQEKAFLQGSGSEPEYIKYMEKGAYSFYDRGNWSGLLNRAFSDEKYANMGQSFVRRQAVDDLICLDRAMLQQDCTRADYYNLEIARIDRKLVKNSYDKAKYIVAVDTAYKRVVPK